MTSLMGLGIVQTIENNTNKTEIEFGTSIGIFGQFKKLIIGVSYEAPDVLVFKVGYQIL